MRPTEMTRPDFVARFGGVCEHSPWVAEAAYDRGLPPDADIAEGLARALAAAMRAAPRARQLDVVRAGLDQCSEEELALFTVLNDTYKSRFGFPFVMAVKGRTRAEILAAFERRVE